ncbi:MAG: DUF2945 domain-containing protein [Pseudomonadota bacterium]
MFDNGDQVKWKWGNGWGEGEVVEVFTNRVSRQIKGAEVVRDATPEEPALLIEQTDGDRVLKSCTEVEKATG